jgi:hypothetical protein
LTQWRVREQCGGAAQGGEAHYELFVWVRGAYRTADIGQESLPLLLPMINPDLFPNGGKQYLMARFPRTGRSSAESLQRSLWSMFFNDNNFFSYRLHREVAQQDVRLRCEILQST